MFNQILFYFSMGINFLADSTEAGISGEPIKEWVLGKVTPILGIFSFAVVICVVFWIAGFWISYAVADEDAKQEKMEKWKKSLKGIVITLIVCTSLGTLMTAIGSVFGVSINL
ncbi:hypothetical protein [Spiroplasma floricola]|uniref:Uncharacterized protein n=1 Tax=Spiroplasma floricola 23-6 TaxID=1336749 RepID=A0A2K8SCV5_9MOLU|nr:hypothetical protein [Spiroplasma floricola]AUB31289.1 hypothetical protein SFLOR_v1c02280 [Spiroplasma floricola 23-6]